MTWLTFCRLAEGSTTLIHDEAPLIAGQTYEVAASTGCDQFDLTGIMYWVTGPYNLCNALYSTGTPESLLGYQCGYVASANWRNGTVPGYGPYYITTQMTLMAWVKVAPHATSRSIIFDRYNFASGYRRGRQLYINSDGKVCGYVWTTTYPTVVIATSTASVDDDTWHHVAVVWKNNAHHIYIDGVLDSTHATSGTILSYGDGTHAWTMLYTLPTYEYSIPVVTGGWRFVGGVQDIRVANHAVTEAELADIVAIPTTHTLGMREHWTLDDAAGTADLADHVYGDEPLSGNRLRVTTGFTVGVAGGRDGTETCVQGLGSSNYEGMYAHRPWYSSESCSFRIWFKPTSNCGRKLFGIEQAKTGDSLAAGEVNWFPTYFGSDGKVHLYQEDTRAGSYPDAHLYSGVLALDVWHEVVVTYLKTGVVVNAAVGNLKLYVDKKLVGSFDGIVFGPHGPRYWRVGGGTLETGWPGVTASGAFIGYLQDAEIFCYQLDEDDIIPPTRISSIMFSCNT